MALEIKIETFEGPLDLLLHLIDKNKVDIYDIPISEITDQYMEYIGGMHKDNMDVASEFLVMAATLIDIKCRMLLPGEINEDGEEEDPRAELVEQLLEYKMYKYMSYELGEREKGSDLVFYHDQQIPDQIKEHREPIDYDELIGDNTLAQLSEIFSQLLKRQEDRVDPIRSKFGNIPKEKIDMDEKTLFIKDYVREHRKFSFRQLLQKQHSKEEIIVTFMVILEEMKIGDIEISQDTTFGEIMINSKI